MQRDINKYANDYLTHMSNEDNFEAFMVESRRAKVLNFLCKYKPKRILEIGCGLDSIFNYYDDYDFFCVIEPSNTFAKKAINDKKIRQNKNIEVIQDFFEYKSTELNNMQFDFIICSSVLHEVNEPKKLINHILKTCNKDTIVHINVPNSQSFHLLWAYESGLIKNIGDLTPRAIKLQQHTTFNLDSLIAFVQDGGGKYFR